MRKIDNKSLEIGRVYDLRYYRDSVYEGMINTPSGFLVHFKSVYGCGVMVSGQRFNLPYSATGIEINSPKSESEGKDE